MYQEVTVLHPLMSFLDKHLVDQHCADSCDAMQSDTLSLPRGSSVLQGASIVWYFPGGWHSEEEASLRMFKRIQESYQESDLSSTLLDPGSLNELLRWGFVPVCWSG